MPAENIFYIGDTARVPYGGKSQQTIERYAIEITAMLLMERAKMIVVACNTASALAVPKLEELLKVPVIGVIEPGARAAAAATRNGHVGVIGTRATVYSRAYETAIHAIDPEIRVTSQPCPMLVPLIEEGWLDDTITDQIIRRYLDKMVRADIDTLVLGCTHYPLLKDALQRFAGPEITLVDSAHNCAAAVKKLLAKEDLAAEEEPPRKTRRRPHRPQRRLPPRGRAGTRPAGRRRAVAHRAAWAMRRCRYPGGVRQSLLHADALVQVALRIVDLQMVGTPGQQTIRKNNQVLFSVDALRSDIGSPPRCPNRKPPAPAPGSAGPPFLPKDPRHFLLVGAQRGQGRRIGQIEHPGDNSIDGKQRERRRLHGQRPGWQHHKPVHLRQRRHRMPAKGRANRNFPSA